MTGDTEGFGDGSNWTMPLSGNLLLQTRFKVNAVTNRLSPKT